IALDIQGTTLGEEKVAKPHNTIAVYPNPSSESIVVEGFNVGEKFQVQVFDIIGTQVLKKQMKTPIIDVSRLNEGIYILRVSNGNQHKTLKFSKKN
ncbi:MAG: T9SS type A sorting domain-containing protein, partial [Flavicella sp.]